MAETPEVRTYDGSDNNLAFPDWGQAGEPLLRLVTPAYVAGAGPSGTDRPNPREISNAVCRQETSPSHPVLTDFIWAWGQFLDHELDLTRESEEDISFKTPANDPQAPGANISMKRSVADASTGTDPLNPRQQPNQLSSYIDGANVYGADTTRAAALRRFDGTGKLKSQDSKHGELLPFNVAGLDNAVRPKMNVAKAFVSGDIRVNEHAVLTSMHTLFMREHNRICDEIRQSEKTLSDEVIYQRARREVGAIMQVITFEEFLPELLGKRALGPYRGYNPYADASISNIFSTACYRLGHSMLSEQIQLARPRGGRLRSIPLREAFFNPDLVLDLGIDVFLAGLAIQNMQQIDVYVVEEVRSFLFNVHPSPPNQPKQLLDLPALNMMRGRDHGLPDYNRCRVEFGLPAKKEMEDICSDEETRDRLRSAYNGNVDLIDPWLGGLAEDHVPGAIVGELIFTVLKNQFERLRSGDRFWYENDPGIPRPDLKRLKKTRLSDVIVRNTRIKQLPSNVFRM